MSQPPPTSSEPVTLVIGHRNPDTDAICSAIGYAELLRLTRMPGALAACCGTPNSRTEWVLEQAELPRPRLVMDVRPRAGDICRRNVDSAAPDDTIFDAYHRMIRSGHRSLPVVDEKGAILGMLNLLDLLQLLIPTDQSGNAVRSVRTTLANVARTLDAETLLAPSDPAAESDYLMLVAGSSEDVVIDRVREFAEHSLILITGDRPAVQFRAVTEGIHCLVITGGFRPDAKVIAAAGENNVPILITGRDTASTTQLIRGSRPIGQAVSTSIVDFDEDTALDDVRSRTAEADSASQLLFPVVEPRTRRLLGVFSRSDLVNPKRARLVLVDHNEFSQAVTGAEQAEIIEVIDHHRLSGNLVTRDPIEFINKTVGSTCTIVAHAFRNQKLTPRRPIAICLCAGIISDTLNLSSPTTTDADREILAWLSGITGLDVDAFTESFFAAGSLLKTCTPAEALASDRKEYLENGYRVSISQIEEVGLNQFWPVQGGLETALRELLATGALDIACVMVTDITRHYSILLVAAPDAVLESIDYPGLPGGVFELEGVVSRKKQLFPWLSNLLRNLPPAKTGSN